MNYASYRRFLILFILPTLIFGSVLDKNKSRFAYSNLDQNKTYYKDQSLKKFTQLEFRAQLRENYKESIKVQNQSIKNKIIKEVPKQNFKNEPEKLRRLLRDAGTWQTFGRFSQIAEFSKLNKTLVDPPTILVNNSSAVSLATGEEFEISVTMTDSAQVKLYYDANKDSSIDAGDLSLFDLRLPFDEGMPDESFYIFDNDDEDEDPVTGSWKISDVRLPYFNIPVIIEITDAGGSASVLIDIANFDGSMEVSGNVITGNSNPGMVIFGGNEYYGNFMTFTDSSGIFSFNVDIQNWNEDILIGGLDAYETVETGQLLVKFLMPMMYWGWQSSFEMSDLVFDVTRNAAVNGSVYTESLDPISNASVGAFSFSMIDAVIGFTHSNIDGEFLLPLQSGREYYLGSSHPDFMESACFDLPLYPSPGDTFNIDCELKPWPSMVQGQVTDINTGDPLKNIDIELEIWSSDSNHYEDSTYYGNGNQYYHDNFWSNTWTDENGFYKMGTVFGSGFLRAFDWEYEKYQFYEVNPFVVDLPNVTENIEMTPWEGLITGVLIDSLTMEAISDAFVYIKSGNADSSYYYYGDMTDNNGNFSIPAMNGNYLVCASVWNSWYTEVCDSVTVLNDTVFVELSISKPAGFVYGYITDSETGDSLAGIDVFIQDNSSNYGMNFYTDSTGYYEFHLENNTWDICFNSWSMTYLDTCVFDLVVNDDSTQLNVALTPITYDGAITGTVLDYDAKPVMSMILAIDTTNTDDKNFVTMTHFDGSYFLPANNGTWLVVAMAMDPKFFPSFEEVTIANDTVEVNFIMTAPVPDAVIYGTVTDSTRNPLGFAKLATGFMDDGMGMMNEYEFTTYGESDEFGNYALNIFGGEGAYYWLAGMYSEGDSSNHLFGYIENILVHSGDSIRVDLVLTQDGDYHHGGMDATNQHGNFRFRWSAQGWVSDGEWPANSGTYYLSEGGLGVMGINTHGKMDTIFAGIVSMDTTIDYGEMGGWSDNMGIGMDDSENFIFRNMGYKNGGMGHDLESNEMVYYPENANFVLIATQLKNKGMHPLSLFGGYAMDFDVTFSDEIDTYDDDLAGSMTVMVPSPINAMMVPVKVSYMYDNDGDNGKSPGIVAIATLTDIADTVMHMSFDLGVWEPETASEMAGIIDLSFDTPDQNTPGDYVIGQFAKFGNIPAGESVGFATLIMAASDTSEFKDMVISGVQLLFDEVMSVDGNNVIPEKFALEQNFPNPFNPTTQIGYSLDKDGFVKLSVFNIIGQEVVTLVNEYQTAGRKRVVWNGKDKAGRSLSGGIYLYRIQSGNNVLTRKMILLK